MSRVLGIEQRLPACSSATRDRRHATRERQGELVRDISDCTPELSAARALGLRSHRRESRPRLMTAKVWVHHSCLNRPLNAASKQA